jgi:hypothetical protein
VTSSTKAALSVQVDGVGLGTVGWGVGVMVGSGVLVSNSGGTVPREASVKMAWTVEAAAVAGSAEVGEAAGCKLQAASRPMGPKKSKRTRNRTLEWLLIGQADRFYTTPARYEVRPGDPGIGKRNEVPAGRTPRF